MIKLGWLFDGNEGVSQDKYESAKWYYLAYREDNKHNAKWLQIKDLLSDDEKDRINELCKEFVCQFRR